MNITFQEILCGSGLNRVRFSIFGKPRTSIFERTLEQIHKYSMVENSANKGGQRIAEFTRLW